MDIKAISGTQASINMNSQNVEALDKKQIQKVQQENQQNQTKQIQDQQGIKDIPQDVLKKAVENMNRKFEMLNSQLKVEVDEDTGMVRWLENFTLAEFLEQGLTISLIWLNTKS